MLSAISMLVRMIMMMVVVMGRNSPLGRFPMPLHQGINYWAKHIGTWRELAGQKPR